MAVYLSEDAERDVEEQLTRTNIQCSVCSHALHLVEEIFEIKLVQPQLRGSELEYFDVVDDQGRLQYASHYFDFMCWEEIEEEIENRHQNTPPVRDQLALLSCDLCGSDIREWETIGLLRYGELHCSPRTPEGFATTVFQNMGRDKHICIGCLFHVNDGWDLWPDEVEPGPGIDVCREGIFERCWRKQRCTCEGHLR